MVDKLLLQLFLLDSLHPEHLPFKLTEYALGLPLFPDCIRSNSGVPVHHFISIHPNIGKVRSKANLPVVAQVHAPNS